jgi:SEC-C motif-containing protein
MRSRFSAYALGEAEYLWRTLASGHEERARLESEALRDIRRSSSTYRYQRLRILDSSEPDAGGVARVLFLARVFLKGRDVSYIERSEFVHEGSGWRYLRGDMRPASAGCETLTLASFEPRA